MVNVKPLTIAIPAATHVTCQGEIVKITGPKGQLSQKIEKSMKVAISDGKLIIEATSIAKKTKALQGLTRALLRNAIVGVNDGYAKTLELSGVGFRAQVAEGELTLALGFSHPVKFKAPAGITFSVAENKITVSGIDKHLVGQIAHTIRAARPPEPYKGKGIRYEGERIRRKAGKAAAKTVGVK